MLACVVAGGLVSNPFEVSIGLKQGCRLCAIIFAIQYAAITLLARHDLCL